MNITVLYFASLADQAQQGQQQLSLDKALTLPELYSQLQSQHGFELTPGKVRVAINDEFASWDDTIEEGDTVAFIPPVAGG
ncbi:molybdopterin converting factor subunit 1 [Psychrobacter sp. FDAARGOS_221]|uniref:molybdopterin converting factor subunit 1 n=1 Tax=Psychrobacter sp. FDAARGOS_221 TaxID=1975705 RepID=UPI000BB55384|nr:molybdopterin converting factor subunit 1 [Psychrobacter sp. FDAARGOS_221]PNK60520.1 molybdopterin converting factor subunit 1 [Psychrobacter sp. FDAARGOS_221]